MSLKKSTKRGSTAARISALTDRLEWSWIEVRLAEWVFSEDSSVDVAVVPITADVIVYGNKTIPDTMFATKEILSKERIGIGHELFFRAYLFRAPEKIPTCQLFAVGQLPQCPANGLGQIGVKLEVM